MMRASELISKMGGKKKIITYWLLPIDKRQDIGRFCAGATSASGIATSVFLVEYLVAIGCSTWLESVH